MAIVPEESDYFSVAHVEYKASLLTDGDGDLWPSCWADDGALYSANGDGLGWGKDDWRDIVVNRIDGTPDTGITGTRLAAGRDVCPVWTDPRKFNSKPTGMIAVDGNGDGRDELYLAVQDLRCGDHPDVFSEAPAAGIVRSDDYGRTWSAGNGPMFTGHRFTTVMFLDFGQSNRGAAVLGPGAENYAYAYGLDYNWRTSVSGCVPDPVDLYLARVPVEAIQDIDAWQFYSGLAGDGNPRWDDDIAAKRPVLTDTRRCPVMPGSSDKGGTFIAQGGVTYFSAFKRYIYSSWTDRAWNFYEAPMPWGPWRRFLHQDFGPHPWTGPHSADAKHGGYATTIPSKFISADGRRSFVQSNWFGNATTYTGNTYLFSLRQLTLAPAIDVEPGAVPADQPPAEVNLAQCDAFPIGTTFHAGHDCVLNDGRTDLAEDSWNGLEKLHDYWGYTWATPRRMNRIVYVTGPHDWTSGWFARPPHVEYLRDGTWEQATGTSITPEYPCDFYATGTNTYTLTFDDVTSSGIRIAGEPTGFHQWYSAISELEVYWDR